MESIYQYALRVMLPPPHSTRILYFEATHREAVAIKEALTTAGFAAGPIASNDPEAARL